MKNFIRGLTSLKYNFVMLDSSNIVSINWWSSDIHAYLLWVGYWKKEDFELAFSSLRNPKFVFYSKFKRSVIWAGTYCLVQVQVIISENCTKPSETSKADFFFSKIVTAINYFRKKLHLRCLGGFCNFLLGVNFCLPLAAKRCGGSDVGRNNVKKNCYCNMIWRNFWCHKLDKIHK